MYLLDYVLHFGNHCNFGDFPHQFIPPTDFYLFLIMQKNHYALIFGGLGRGGGKGTCMYLRIYFLYFGSI